MTKKEKALVGCQGWFDDKGYFILQSNLKVYQYNNRGDGPIFTFIGRKKDDYLLTNDGMSWSRIDKKFVKII